MEGQVRKAEAGMHKVEYHSADLEKSARGTPKQRKEIASGFPSEHSKGVHQESNSYGNVSTSHMGAAARSGAYKQGAGNYQKKFGEANKEHAKSILGEARSMPKPNLPKSEEGMDKAEKLDGLVYGGICGLGGLRPRHA